MTEVRISVRRLVEFILRCGDITSGGGRMDSDAMQEGSRMHRKIQKRMGTGYQAEVALSATIPFETDTDSVELIVEGRADGVYSRDTSEECHWGIDEIKCMYMPLEHLKEPIAIHQAQAKCYAYMYARDKEQDAMEIQMTYCNLDTEEIKRFSETFSYGELKDWFDGVVREYIKWIRYEMEWIGERNQSLQAQDFPFSYRPGQKELVTGVYQSILRKKRLYIEAPTGVGKTISTVFPTVKAMGEGLVDRVFYLTAKTITRTVAQETLEILREHGSRLKIVTLTAKDKICILEKPQCNPDTCERAKGHYDRINDAVFDLLTHENHVSRELIQEYADRHSVCPFEMSLDLALWVDVVICDYNYVFDPQVYLRRFFEGGGSDSYAFLIDEAHNLVERGREMYSATLVKEDFLAVKKVIGQKSQKLTRALNQCNKTLLSYKRECDECQVMDSVGTFSLQLMRLIAALEEFLQEEPSVGERETVLDFYFGVRKFFSTYELLDEKYMIYSDYGESGEFRLHLQCMDPSTNLGLCLEKARSAVFFSATLLPIKYYLEQLAGREEDYAVYAPSPFLPENRLLLIARDVSTKYTRRTGAEFAKIAAYIYELLRIKAGNYLAFFPSYQLMRQVQEQLEIRLAELEQEMPVKLMVQDSHMSEEQREEFLREFEAEESMTKLGLCVMGGIFSEGIDLKEDRLIGAVMVGTGLPMVCNERELFRQYYEERSGQGFAYAYLYPGMNKVLQAAGRVIRTDRDRGVILLLDERFHTASYRSLFPREWADYDSVTVRTFQSKVQQFWENTGKKLTE